MRGSIMQVPLLVLGLLSLITPLVHAQDERYKDVVTEIQKYRNTEIQKYNKNSGPENLFRLSILNLQTRNNKDPAAPQLVTFTLRETVCSKTENRDPDECDFKENGLVKECIGTIDLNSSSPSESISCDGPEKIKRRLLPWIIGILIG
ncbi:LOW QUALITY PROTEIN: antibacterial protein PR-39-like [Notamacropus eugenii]|uniref:LOW QUALITY PROTEIN: antibacterial protein PR-39-like n=1 Tax=Notamacropus eugenii TaxID=9315 RepID=UPI003B66F8FC